MPIDTRNDENYFSNLENALDNIGVDLIQDAKIRNIEDIFKDIAKKWNYL